MICIGQLWDNAAILVHYGDRVKCPATVMRRTGDQIEQTHSFTKWDAAPNLTHWVSYQIWNDEYFLSWCSLLALFNLLFPPRRCNNNTSEAWLLLPVPFSLVRGCWSVFTPLIITAVHSLTILGNGMKKDRQSQTGSTANLSRLKVCSLIPDPHVFVEDWCFLVFVHILV